MTLLALLLFAQHAFANCASPAAAAGTLQFNSPNMQYCDGTNWVSTAVSTAGSCSTAGQILASGTDLQYCDGAILHSMSGHTISSCTGTAVGTYAYDSGNQVFKYCDGTNWRLMAPNRGFLIMSAGAFAGNIGGLSGANSFCLSDLQANGFITSIYGQLDSSHVRAFLCDTGTCQIGKPSTTYALGISGDTVSGGATFTTDAAGLGPNNATSWAGTTTMGTAGHTYWTGDSGGTSTAWGATPSVTCTGWTTTTGTGTYGANNFTNGNRWTASTQNCAVSQRVLCFVDP